MVHKRYVTKNGKVYGPYTYHSYRDNDGNVKKRYLGKHIEMSKKGLTLVFFMFLIMLFSFSMIVKVFLQFVL